MLLYHARILDRERRPVVSLAVLGDEDPDWRPDGYSSELWGCSLSLRFPMVKLLDLDAATLERTRNPFATLTLIHRDALETSGKPGERLQRKVARYRALLQLGYEASDVRTLLRLIEHILRLDPVRAQRARDKMRQVEVEVTGMDTFVTSFEEIARAEGRVEGRAEGRIEGRAEGQRDIVLRLLNRKVGPLTEELHVRASRLSPESLLTLSEALLDFTDQSDLIAWLERNASQGAS